jgi:PAS domain S-box-containing protein
METVYGPETYDYQCFCVIELLLPDSESNISMIKLLSARFALQRKIGWLLLFSFFSLCLIGWLLYSNKKNFVATTNWINHTHTVIQHIDKVKTRIATWKALHRPPIDTAFHRELMQDITRIKELTIDNPLQQGSVDSLTIAIDSLSPATDSLSLAALKTLLNGMQQVERDLLAQRHDKNREADQRDTWLLIGSSALAFLFIVVILLRLNRDIQLRRQAQKKLKQNQTWLESILENTTSLIYIKDPAGCYVMVNRRFREVLQVREEEVIGHTDADFSTPEAAAHYRSLDERVVRMLRSVEGEEVVSGAGGDIHFLSIKFPLLDHNGQLIGIGGIATEITERVHYQQQLIAATREAQDAKSMQELFLANMSHEIRTPMNGIQGMTDLLLDTPLSDQQKEFAKIIKRSVNNLLVIVNDVLDFSKIKAGKLAIEHIEFRLKDVMDNVRAIFTHRVAKKGLELQLELDPAIPELLKGDPYRLNQVLINLIGNALKFTEQGWIRVQVTAQERTSDRVNLQFIVADSGIGISEAGLPYIFDHFSQAGLDISRRYGGTGLGLAICHQLLQLQGGEISVKSRENEGTVFTFRTPYGYNGTANGTASGTPMAAIIADYSQCLTGRRILVAEDNEVNQQLVDHVLRKGGGEVQLAGNGKEALDLLRSGERYDLIIMDLQMPVMDGYEATQYIRQELHLSTPIIAMTATALVGEQLHCFEVGMNDYMTKPFEFGELYKKINSLLATPNGDFSQGWIWRPSQTGS